MYQIIHILKKDFRRFAFEISLAMLLLALYTWSVPGTWLPDDIWFNGGLVGFANSNEPILLAALLAMGWSILLVRLIHEESPAGERQFWVSRPYQWPQLLAAKVVFMLLVVSLPLLIAQMAILAMAGFSPFHYFAGLLRIRLELYTYILFGAALTVVASGIMQISRAVLVLLLYLAGSWWVHSLLRDASAWHGSSIWQWLERGILVGVTLAVIVLQFARRRTNRARLFLVGAALASLLLTAATPYRRLIEHEYPRQAAGEQPLFQLQLHSLSRQAIRFKGKDVWISLGLSTGQVAPGYVVQVEAVHVTLDAPDGTRWDPGWHPAYKLLSREKSEFQEPGQIVGIGPWDHMDAGTFDRLSNVPLKAHVAVTATVFRDEEGKVVTPDQDQFEVPGVGICAIRGTTTGTLWCRSPLRRPTLLGVTGRNFLHCPPEADDLAKPVELTHWTANFLPDMAENGFSPVSSYMAYFGAHLGNNQHAGICPGTPLTFRLPQMIGKVRVEAEFDEFRIQKQ